MTEKVWNDAVVDVSLNITPFTEQSVFGGKSLLSSHQNRSCRLITFYSTYKFKTLHVVCVGIHGAVQDMLGNKKTAVIDNSLYYFL